jgi:hypothetical protein
VVAIITEWTKFQNLCIHCHSFQQIKIVVTEEGASTLRTINLYGAPLRTVTDIKVNDPKDLAANSKTHYVSALINLTSRVWPLFRKQTHCMTRLVYVSDFNTPYNGYVRRFVLNWHHGEVVAQPATTAIKGTAVPNLLIQAMLDFM